MLSRESEGWGLRFGPQVGELLIATEHPCVGQAGVKKRRGEREDLSFLDQYSHRAATTEVSRNCHVG